MTNNPQKELKDLIKEKDFFIGIDSDGCVFDTMEIKHKECFCPNVTKVWELQTISKYVRETWDFVNLYSKTRGCNRFLAIKEAFKLLNARKEVQARDVKMPDITPLLEWIEKETKLGEPVLEQYAKQVNDPIINTALAWSKAVNKTVREMVYGIAPFPYVKESLQKMTEKGDAIVVSQTPVEALVREWEENDMKKYVKVIAGQEYGTKIEHLALAAKGKYDDNKILMIGDAPGDYKAAEKNGVLFYPINPGHEEKSWERFYNEALDKFFDGTFEGEYQQKILAEFNNYLPELPPWK